MAIDTTNEKLALLGWHQTGQAAVPISSDGLGQDDKQQLIWGYPGILWGGGAAGVDNTKLSMLHYMQVYQPPPPYSTDGLGQGDLQQLLWGYPDILWASAAVGSSFLDTGDIGTVILNEQRMERGYRIFRFDWRTDDTGEASHIFHRSMWGYLYSVVTIPAGGDSTPSADYDIELLDAEGFDLLRGDGANRSDTLDQEVALNLAVKQPYPAATDRFRLRVQNAGAENRGIVLVSVLDRPGLLPGLRGNILQVR